MAEQQKFTIKVSKKMSESVKEALGQEVIDFIIDRTVNKRMDKTNTPFKGSYSDSYASSFEFKLAGKSKDKINLSLSSEMLNAIEVLDTSIDGEITIGIPASDTFNNQKAEGNIKGTYGQKKPIKGKARDFMGIKSNDLNSLKSLFPISTKEEREVSERLAGIYDIASRAGESFAVSLLNIEGEEDA
jgi:hypothetical protein